jgi:hypothetical protein
VLGEDVVEDVRELAIRLDERVRAWGFEDGGFAVRCMRRRNSRKVMPHRHSFPFRALEIPRKGELADEQVDRARGREQGEAADCESLRRVASSFPCSSVKRL